MAQPITFAAGSAGPITVSVPIIDDSTEGTSEDTAKRTKPDDKSPSTSPEPQTDIKHNTQQPAGGQEHKERKENEENNKEHITESTKNPRGAKPQKKRPKISRHSRHLLANSPTLIANAIFHLRRCVAANCAAIRQLCTATQELDQH